MASQGSQGDNSRLFGIVLSTRDSFDTRRQGMENMSDRRFAGKVALITGATSGIGRACVIAFATAGAKVACVGRNENALQDVSERIRALDSEALTVKADLSSATEAERVVNETVTKFGGIDVVVNAAGHISSGT